MITELLIAGSYNPSGGYGIETISDQSDPTCLYVGVCKAGTKTSDIGWVIYRTKISGKIAYTRMADKRGNFTKVWDLRTSYDYTDVI